MNHGLEVYSRTKSLDLLEQRSKAFRFNVDGEGGEYETLVVAGPHLGGRLQCKGTVQWDGTRGTFEFDDVTTVSV